MDEADCPISTTIDVIGGKWKPLILFFLKDGPQRFGALRRHIPAATQKVLTDHLRDLERDGIVHREVFAVIPPRVEYSMTDYGRTLRPLLAAMAAWGSIHREREASRRHGAEVADRAHSPASSPHLDRSHGTPGLGTVGGDG